MILLIGGFVTGALHVLSGPDHLTAIAPLAARHPRGSWATGLRWGFGHSSGVILAGVLALVLRETFHVGLVSSFSDRLVGLFLVGIGLWTLRGAWRIRPHEHPRPQRHSYVFAPGRNVHSGHTHAAFGIGTLHGLAGSSHFLGVLPALALPSSTLALAYLLAFGAGTMAAMMGFSHTIGLVAARCALHGSDARIHRFMMLTCASLAIITGGVWLAGYGF